MSDTSIRRKRNFKQLKLPTASPSASAPHSPVESKKNVYENLSEQLSDLEIGVEFKVDLRLEDLQIMADLGEGSGGSVSKVLHVPTKTIMARKVFILMSQAPFFYTGCNQGHHHRSK
jgi:mitogen-activated protein kinase kinase